MAQSKSEKTEKPARRQGKGDDGKISLYGLSVEDAIRAAARTGRPPMMPTAKPKQRRKKANVR
jgi:hypothetical protein